MFLPQLIMVLHCFFPLTSQRSQTSKITIQMNYRNQKKKDEISVSLFPFHSHIRLFGFSLVYIMHLSLCHFCLHAKRCTFNDDCCMSARYHSFVRTISNSLMLCPPVISYKPTILHKKNINIIHICNRIGTVCAVARLYHSYLYIT